MCATVCEEASYSQRSPQSGVDVYGLRIQKLLEEFLTMGRKRWSVSSGALVGHGARRCDDYIHSLEFIIFSGLSQTTLNYLRYIYNHYVCIMDEQVPFLVWLKIRNIIMPNFVMSQCRI